MIAAAEEALAPIQSSRAVSPGYVAGSGTAARPICRRRDARRSAPGRRWRDTVFRIASLSKPVGGVLALTLVEEGRSRSTTR